MLRPTRSLTSSATGRRMSSSPRCWRGTKKVMRRLSLENVVGVAWMVTLVGFLVLPAIKQTDPPVLIRLFCLVAIPTGILALPVAIISSLLLAFRHVSRPHDD